jgi:signal transduction histidine kinase
MGRGLMLSGKVYAFVGRDLQDINETEEGILYAFGVVLLASLILASISGILLSRVFLRRIDTITATCRSIMAGRLGERIPVASRRSEFEHLGLAINAMLDRIQALMDSLRQVSTDIAHDLRTPLTHLRHKLERARNDAESPQDYAVAVDGAVEECDKLLGMFTALLRIAQIEAGARRAEFQPVDLKLLVQNVRDIYAPVMDDSKHVFRVDAGTVPLLRGDAQLLLLLIANLLDNAITHTPTGSEITLFCGVCGERPKFAVTDNGPGIAEADRKNVLRRFYRCEQSRTTAGSGLGLSLVAAVSELHDASLVLDDNKPGLRVEVVFPPFSP